MVKGLGGKFTPAHDSDLELAKQLKVGEVYKFTFTKPRNYDLLKKFFALMKLVFDNQEQYTDRNIHRKHLIKAAGYTVEEVNYITGEVTEEAESIAYDSMDDVRFGELYRAMLDTVIRVYGWEGTDLEAEVAEFM